MVKSTAGRFAMLFVLTAVVCLASGCSHKAQFGSKKQDWAKTPPPSWYRGPGQPGGPATGPKSAPAAAPSAPASR